MTLPQQYAQALYSLIEVSPKKGKEYTANLKEALKRRGHERLLPSIFSELQKLQLKDDREHARESELQESERTRILLELYRTLITA